MTLNTFMIKINTYTHTNQSTAGHARKILHWSLLNHEKEWISLVLIRLSENENNLIMK